MAEYKNYGVTSSIVPGLEGISGKRSPITFFGDYNEEPTTMNYDIEIIFEDNTRRNIYNKTVDSRSDTGKVKPAKDDIIIYSSPNKAGLYIIDSTKLLQKTHVCYVRELDKWDVTDENTVEDPSDISINVSVERKQFNINTINESYMPEYGITTVGLKTKNILSTSLRTFRVVSTNPDSKLGKYRITLEFITTDNATSPAMDTIIPEMFINKELNLISMSGANPTGKTYIDDVCTARGYLHRYDRSVNTSFDSERLDDFTLTIKDFDDGLNAQAFMTDIMIPTQPIMRTGAENYRCYIYIYTSNPDNTYTKSLIGEIDINDIL